MFDLHLHWLILFVVRILRFQAVVHMIFRWLIPACVIQNWKTVGLSHQQLVMEHELFRHVELELFVQQDQLARALTFLICSLEYAGEKAAC